MRAASRALTVVFAVVALGAPAGAQTPAPQCPATVDGLPLSVATPFSGTPRPVAGDDGEIASTSLLCAYGEGVEPSAEVLVTWDAGASCASTETEVAPGLDADPFTAVADDLAATLGGLCPPAAASNPPVAPVALAAAAAAVLALVALVAVVARRRRRRRRASGTASRSGSSPDHPAGQERDQNEEDPVVAGTTSRSGSSPDHPAGQERDQNDEDPVVAGATSRSVTSGVLPGSEGWSQNEEGEGARADLTPVLALLATRHGRALARSEEGQRLAIAALAHATDRPEAAAVVRAGGHPGRRPARAELAGLAEGLAHQATAGDR